ncbi:MAG: DUF4399 domain-containing protein [Hyphomicrobiales bacterium]|nr:DUF4399 domain-containing protein [Hyphomicrobiales bacterium]
MKKLLAAATIAAFTMTGAALAGDTPSPPGASVYFVNLADGATVKSPVKVVFGLTGMGVAPAGTEKDKTGHHHILIDRPALGKGAGGADEFNANLPADDNHKHFGGGQTEVMLDLPAGKHTLQLVLGDKDHIPHNPPVTSPVITITVE